MPSMKGDEWKVSERALIVRINQEKRLMYYFTALNGLSTTIEVDDDWANYIKRNQEIIGGWLEYNMILYLQKRNPSVPGIADKLYPPLERKLEKVKKYWKLIIGVEPVREIYGNGILTEKDISIDHFVPWSYVAHDEMWNLNPTTKSINSSKSNNLPDWETYFERLARQEYQSYQLMWKYEQIHKEHYKHIIQYGVEFTKCIDSKGKISFKNNLPNKSETEIIHVRPHSAKAAYRFSNGEEYGNVERDANILPNGEYMTTQSFWINNNYILAQLKCLK